MPSRLQRRYAPHVRDLVSQHGDLKLAIAQGVPRSTAAGWLRSGPRPLLTLDDGRDRAALHAENLELRRQLARAGALLKLLLVVIRVLGLDFHGRRILERRSRERTLRAITSAREHVSLRRVLRLIRLSRSRFHEWSREPSRRVLAQVDVRFSNSMIEAWWRSLKHQWLFLHELANQDQAEQLVHFYVEQHRTVIPHAAFCGQTPDEMYFGTGVGVFEELELK